MSDGYLGNQYLKKTGVAVEWTPELIREYGKCASDPIYFAKKYIKIVHVDKGFVPFEMYPYQEKIAKEISENRRVAVLTARQSGKALALDTPIPLFSGAWSTIGDLKIGDNIVGSDGRPTRVTFKSEIHHKPSYKITFRRTGTSVVACEDHLWAVWDSAESKHITVSTKELADKMSFGRYSIPAIQPIQYGEVELSDTPLEVGATIHHGNRIPSEYMLASVDQRTDVLRGVLGVTGSVDGQRVVELRGANRLAEDDVHQLATGLGFVVTIVRVDPADATYVVIDRSDGISREIATIELVDTVPTQCITVDSEDSLFAFGKDYILTHNTTTAMAIILHYILFNEFKTVAILANKGDSAREVLSRVKMAYEALPKWLQQGVLEWNKGSIELENGCKIYAGTTSSSAIRGKSISFLYLDEVAFIEGYDEFFASVYPTISSGDTTKLLMTSCVTADTYVWGRDGLAQVGDFVDIEQPANPEQGYFVAPYAVTGMDGMRNGRVMVNSGMATTRKIKTRYSHLECSMNHKLWASKDGDSYEWTESKNLDVGDWLTIKHNHRVFGNNDLINVGESQVRVDPVLAYSLGAYISGKGVTRGDVAPIADCIGVDLFDAMHVRIPTDLLRMSEPNIVALIRGVFGGEEILSSKSKVLVEQVLMLLQNLGMLSIMRREEDTYVLSLDGQYAAKFARDISGDLDVGSGADTDLEVVRIESIEQSYSAVYDFSLDHVDGDDWCHSVAYNGIVGHQTPNGLNHFYKTCEGAREGTNGYKYVEVMWNDVPGRDEKWKEETLAALDHDIEKFNVEYCCQFLGSSGTLISGEKLKTLKEKRVAAEGGSARQYVAPVKDHSYALIADVSRGKGLDYSAFTIVDITSMPYVQVCTYRDNMVGPADYASVIHRFGKLYNDAHTLIEVNDIGGQVADTLFFEYGYENMLFTEHGGRSGKRISGGFGKGTDRGIRTSKSVKSIGCSILKLLIEQEQLIVNDETTIEELKHFSRKGTSYEAESGWHDDMVMTLVLFAWLSDQNYFKDVTDINTLMMLRELTEDQLEDGLIPFGFITSYNQMESFVDSVGDVWLEV